MSVYLAGFCSGAGGMLALVVIGADLSGHGSALTIGLAVLATCLSLVGVMHLSSTREA